METYKTIFVFKDLFEVEAEVHYSFQNDSYDDEFGTVVLPDYILIESILVDEKEISDESLVSDYGTSKEELISEIESSLK